MDNLFNSAQGIMTQVQKVVVGKDECIYKVLMAILAKGHILMEDIPGVGKTTMAMAFSKAMDLNVKRLQFTPDVLPSDVTGYYMFNKETQMFKYVPGAIMCNLLLADEINRTSPKTQSALLEVMEEGKVTLEGRTREVPHPFVVIATQNPVGSIGTQRLPESQLDRFMICLTLGYPEIQDEIRMMASRQQNQPLDQVQPVIGQERLLAMQEAVDNVYVHQTVYEYIARLSEATRNHPLVALGVSPRGTLSLCQMAKSCAWLSGRAYVIPDDVFRVFKDVAGHRMILEAKSRINHVTIEAVITEILNKIPKPQPRGR